jgi:uncharacterized membrane protein (UPF0127 family)
MKVLIPIVYSILLTFLSPTVGNGTNQHGILEIQGWSVFVETARTPKELRLGLMHRKTLGANSGMLFIYRRPKIACMWMKNTHIPLSVLFIDSNFVITSIEHMSPNTETPHCSVKSVGYSLEVNQSWVKSKNITPNHKVRGIDFFLP